MNPDDLATKCWYLTGATASGKTRYGLALARTLGAEIVSMDSMAVFRGMDIGTAKPTAAEQREIPHHLIDIVDPDVEFSLAQYVDAAQAAVDEIRGRGREVLFVGGTPLYLKALLRGIFSGPPPDWELRKQIESEAAALSPDALHRRVAQVDPLAASTIHPNDTRRLIRALEVYRATGEPISHQQMEFESQRSSDECRVFVLDRTRQEQHDRINRRVDEMVERGLLDEARKLTSDGRGMGRTARQAVGYNEALEHLAGKLDREGMVQRIKARTRQFAKRQRTWFRSLSECRFLPIEGDADPDETVRQIVRSVGSW